MSIATGPVSLFRKPLKSLPVGVWVPLVGMAWVFFNVSLVILGIRDPSRPSLVFSLLAGGIDGGIVGSIVIATFSERLHAGAAGVLGGYGIQDVMNNFKLTGQGVHWIHEQLDPLLDAVVGNRFEPLHQAIQKEIIWMACTAAFVVLATLVVQLLRTTGSKPSRVY